MDTERISEEAAASREPEGSPSGALEALPGVADWFVGRAVLLTGGTGFLGKALVEKLLRSCPGVAAVYLLLRRDGKRSTGERIAELVKNAVFDRLRIEQGDSWIEKLRVVEGDLSRLSLDISDHDREMLGRGDSLIPGVSVVLHCGATVRWDEEIRKAVLLNTRGTREMVRLGCSLPSLKAFVHVSTAFCHFDRVHLEEVVYPSHVDHNRVIEYAEKENDSTLETMAPRLLKGFPNEHLFSKSLAEQVIYHSRHKIPAAIFRPSVVCPAVEEPFPGWVQSSNGPVGILKCAGSGVLRSAYGDGDLLTDLLPVDFAVSAILAIAWKIGTQHGDFRGRSEDARIREDFPLAVYNGTTGSEAPISWNQFLDTGRVAYENYPYPPVIWYPGGGIYKNRLIHLICFVLFQLMPAALADFVLILKWKRPSYAKLQLKLFVAMRSLEFFLTRPWSFDNRKLLELRGLLPPGDGSVFRFTAEGLDYKVYLKRWALGVRRYIMMADDDTLPRHRRKLRRLFWAHTTLRVALWLAVAWMLTSSIGPFGGMEKVTVCLPCSCLM